jgi:hypothetical protein
VSVLRWEDPPEDARGANVTDRWQAIAEELRAHPERWAVVVESTSGACGAWVNRIRTGKSAFKPAGAFEAVSRADGKEVRVYARYVGGDES